MPRIATTSSLSSYPKISISQYRKQLTTSLTSHITLDYSHRDKPYRYDVGITTTKCNYGGYRHWWHCPQCSKRVGVLYCAGLYVCRHCISENYETQLMQPLDKLFRKVEKIRHRLGWQAGIANKHGNRPKGMHRKTYDRLVWEHDNLAKKIIGDTCKQMKITLPSYKD